MTKNTETLSGAEAVQAGFSHSKTIEITMAALFIALTYVATAFINVRIPFLAANGGLIHLGNIPLFVAAALYGKRTGALAGALDMGLFDLTPDGYPGHRLTFVTCRAHRICICSRCRQEGRKGTPCSGCICSGTYQGGRILYCRDFPLRKPCSTGYFYSRQSCSDLCCRCDRSTCYPGTSESAS